MQIIERIERIASIGDRIGYSPAEDEAQELAAGWMAEAGLEADSIVGSSDPIEAVHEAWNPGRFDEIIVSTLPGRSSRWLRLDYPHRVAAFTGAPVTHVVAMDMRPEPAHGPPPEHERSPLGPLGVLAWGGPRDETS